MVEILSTKKLLPQQKALLEKAGIGCIDEDFIRILPMDFKVSKTVENAIITSQNTVQRLVEEKVAITHCFCVGEKTQALLKQHGYKVVAKADYGKDLAQLILKDYADRSFHLFCGNLRRDELPNLLEKHQIPLEETHVYQTLASPQRLTSKFDALLFFSPSAVKSYAALNNFDNTPAFCIGTTTQAAARHYTNNLITANDTTVEGVLWQVIKHFKQRSYD